MSFGIRKPHPLDDKADIVLILEGTYPYVMGGVSSWVHRLITEMPELDFGIVHIAPRVGHYGDQPAYKVPENVAFVEQFGLLPDRQEGSKRRRRRLHKQMTELWNELVHLRHADLTALTKLAERFEKLRERGITPDDIVAGDASWDALVNCYESEAADQSFLNFYWTWRFAYQPMIEMLFQRVPRGGMYHTVSTGYAGMLAAVTGARWERPMIVTEHGIYTKERRIEIYSANWIRDVDGDELVVDSQAPYFRAFWNRHFEVMSRCCYHQADRIFTLYGQNREAQVADGAEPSKIEIIPNGVDVDSLDKALTDAPPRDPDAPFTVAFVGRVTPIKDVRTFLAAMRLVAHQVGDVRVRVLGPMSEDRDYAEKCQLFARELGLEDNVSFEGAVNIKKELPSVDVLLLTSISEAQPLVVLEAGALGVPVVATDVGSCRELLEGRTAADQAIGTGGLLTPIATPGAVAEKVLELYRDPDMRKRMGEVLKERVRRFYDERDMIAAYRKIYSSCLHPEAV